MTKREIAKLPDAEQEFIYSYGLQYCDYDTVKWYEKNYDLAVYKGLI